MIRGIRGHREVGILNQVVDILLEHDEVPNGVGFQGNQRIRLAGVLEGKQTVMASYWRVSHSHSRSLLEMKGSGREPKLSRSVPLQ